jgi:DNA invertase Pin-like site-specific DNA recombinase
MLTVFGAVAELEREYILQRQREGIAIAKVNGAYKGRKPLERPNMESVLSLWREGKITATEAMKRLNVSRSTFYRRAKRKEYKEDGTNAGKCAIITLKKVYHYEQCTL